MVDLVIPENPEPIITGLGFAFAMETASGDIVCASHVVMETEAKHGGLKTEGVDRTKAATAMADSIVKFAAGVDGVVRVRLMSPQEYADWCEENEDDLDSEDEDELQDDD